MPETAKQILDLCIANGMFVRAYKYVNVAISSPKDNVFEQRTESMQIV